MSSTNTKGYCEEIRPLIQYFYYDGNNGIEAVAFCGEVPPKYPVYIVSYPLGFNYYEPDDFFKYYRIVNVEED